MRELSLKERTAKGVFWGGVSNGIQQILTLVFGIYLARILNPDDYGLINMLAIFTGIATTLINSGFTVALTNKKDVTHNDYNAVFWFTVFVGLACYVILFLSAPIIAEFYERKELIRLSRVVFLSFFLSGIASVSYTVLFKQLMVKKQAQIDITAMLLAGIVGVTLAIRGYAYWALTFQNLVYIGVGAILRFKIAPWKPTFEIDFKPLKGMFSFSVKLFFTNIFQQISNNVFSVLIGKFYNATQLGYYAQGQKWMLMGHQSIGGMINSVSQPVLVESGDSLERQQNVFHKLVRFAAFISFPLMLGFAFVGKEFILITVGEKWIPSLFFLQLFCLWGAIGFLPALYSLLLLTHGKSSVYMNVTVATGFLQFISIVLSFRFGINIMVSAYVLFTYFSIFIWQYYSHKYVQIKFLDIVKDIFPYFAITLVSLFVAFVSVVFITNIILSFFLKILISFICYLSLLWITNSKILKDSISFIFKK